MPKRISLNQYISSLSSNIFKLKIYSNRWGHYDVYDFKVTKNGWHISHLTIGGSCKKDGKPYLFKNLNQDLISYPSDLNFVMEELWNKITKKRINKPQINAKLKKIAVWISKCEKYKPKI